MIFVTERGDHFQIPDEQIPDGCKEWLWNKTFMFHEDEKLEDCWVASVYKKDFDARPAEYNYAGEKIFDHEPTKEELFFLMASYDAVRFSYVMVDKALRYHEEYD